MFIHIFILFFVLTGSGDHQVVDLVDLSVDTNVAQVLVSKGLAQIVQKSQASSPSRPSKSEEVSKPRSVSSKDRKSLWCDLQIYVHHTQ